MVSMQLDKNTPHSATKAGEQIFEIVIHSERKTSLCECYNRLGTIWLISSYDFDDFIFWQYGPSNCLQKFYMYIRKNLFSEKVWFIKKNK